MPPAAASLQNPGRASGTGRKRRTRPKGVAGNPQLLRNIVIVGAVLFVLGGVGMTIIFGAMGSRGGDSKDLSGRAGASTDGSGEGLLEGQKQPVLGIERANRSNEEILRQAQEDFQRGQVYYREAAIGDENLWQSIRFYQQAEAELRLIDPELRPPYTRELSSQIQRAQGMLDKETSRIKMSFVGHYQSNDFVRASADLELLLRVVPAPEDPRYMWAKKNLAKVKKRLRSMPKKKGPL